MNSLKERALEYHRKGPGKIKTQPVHEELTKDELALAYTPGVGEVSSAIHAGEVSVNDVTTKNTTIAVVSDGSAVLGLGNIGPEAAMPVMEGKAILFKEFSGLNAVPICLNTQDTEEIISIVKALEPTFGGVNLEDISAPRCFEIEERLKKEMNIPVMHDDQHGTAVVVTAGMINALKLTGRTFEGARFVVSGAGAAGVAITKMLNNMGAEDIVVLDSKGAIVEGRGDLNEVKQQLAKDTNPEKRSGTMADVLAGADVFIGVSAPGILSKEMVQSMANDPIVFALSNPVPEIMPDIAKDAGAAIVSTGRSDFPNQVNNVLAFPGLFKAALEHKTGSITEDMKMKAAQALANHIEPDPEHILPDVFDKTVVPAIVEALRIS